MEEGDNDSAGPVSETPPRSPQTATINTATAGMGALEPHHFPGLRPLNTKGFVQNGSGWAEATSKTGCVPQCGQDQPPTCQPIPLIPVLRAYLGQSRQEFVCLPYAPTCPGLLEALPSTLRKTCWPGNGQCETSFYEKRSGTEPEQKTNTEFYLSCIPSLEPCLAHIRHSTNNT